MKIYTVHDQGKYRSFCYAYATLDEAMNKFNRLLNYHKRDCLNKTDHPVKDWTDEGIPSQLRVAIIKNAFSDGESMILYLTEHDI